MVKKDKKEDAAGLVFVGALFIGMALGMFYGNVAVGVLAGLGVGFILMALVRILLKK
jgi:hypothetical protein